MFQSNQKANGPPAAFGTGSLDAPSSVAGLRAVQLTGAQRTAYCAETSESWFRHRHIGALLNRFTQRLHGLTRGTSNSSAPNEPPMRCVVPQVRLRERTCSHWVLSDLPGTPATTGRRWRRRISQARHSLRCLGPRTGFTIPTTHRNHLQSRSDEREANIPRNQALEIAARLRDRGAVAVNEH